MSFSDKLLKQAQPIMDAIMVHPFVEAIGNGHVPDNVLNYYVEQDEHYLKDYLRVTALAITKATCSEDIDNFLATAQFVQNESRAHQIILDITGHQVENWRCEPETKRYTDHMYTAAYHGTYADTIAALLPCAWSYAIIGEKLVSRGANHANNPLKEWIELYAPQFNTEMPDYNDWRFKSLNRAVESLSAIEKEQVTQTFLFSLEMEWHFWNAAWYQNHWQFEF
ncbi:thiaminase II [Leuconostoc palmae]|uniref:thiaminase II n=1 Tax=Leuconostoc palmae TaxID=501487 RepID=UPI001C7CEBBD|nr:thiaminase II [Leuconostoc palmae]